MNCKIAILVCVIASSVTVEAINRKQMSEVADMSEEEIDELLSACQKENHMTDEDIADLDFMLENNTLPAEKTGEYLKDLGCFLSCAYEKLDIMLDEVIKKDTALRMLERYDLVMKDQKFDSVRDCLYKVKDETNKCDTAFLFTLCFLEQDESSDEE